MLMSVPVELRAEDGTTMVELLVGLAVGMIVVVGLTMTIIVTLHGNARVDARVEATDNAHLVMTRVMEELHSACISPQIAPVQQGSTGNSLIFWHAARGESTAVEPKPVKTKLVYENGSLVQTDYAKTGGTSPNWIFEEEKAGSGSKVILLTNVAPAAGTTAVFSYYKYENGTLVKLTAPSLAKTEAETVIVVKAGLTASPKSTPVKDAGASATITDSATLRLTPPSFNEGSSALPCQ